MINFLKGKPSILGSFFVLVILFVNSACPPPDLKLKFHTSSDKFRTRSNQTDRKIESKLIFNNDTLSMEIYGKIADYNYDNYQIFRSLYIGLNLKSEFDIKFIADSTRIIDNSGMKLYPHAHSVFNKNNFYKKDDLHELAIIYRSKSNPINSPVRLYLPKIHILRNNSMIKTIDFQKIELTPLIDKDYAED